MKRRLLNLVTALSLLLCATALGAWWSRSHKPVFTYVYWHTSDLTITGGSITVACSDGDWWLHRETYWEVFDEQDVLRRESDWLPARGIHAVYQTFKGEDGGGRSPKWYWEWWRLRASHDENEDRRIPTDGEDETVTMRLSWTDVSLPAWLPALLFAILPTFRAMSALRACARPGPGHCQKCGYDLTGNVSGVCPECGQAR